MTGFIDTLGKEFPASKVKNFEVVQEEVAEFKEREGLKLFCAIAGDNDKLLCEAIQELLASRGDTWKNFDIAGDESSSVHVGNAFASDAVRQSGSNSFEGFKIGGAGHSHIGDSYIA